MKSCKVRFALVGAGAVAQAYAQAFENHPWAELVAVADTRPEAARALAERFDCPSYSSFEAMADGPAAFEAVLICTPPNTHEAISLYFLARKTHVLCEKPLCLGAAAARNMVRAAERAGVLLTMGAKFRYAEDVVRAKAIVVSGILGEIILLENVFASRVEMSARWNSDPAVSGGGVLIDNGSHSVDLVRYFLGPIAWLQAIEGKRSQKLPVEDTVLVLARAAGGAMAQIDLSWSLNKEQPGYLNIFGTNGTLSVGWKESKYRHASSPDWVLFGRGYDKIQAFRSQIQNFARAIRGQEDLRITAEDALASVEVIEAAYQALREQHWMRVRAERRPSWPPAAARPQASASLGAES